MVPTATHSRPPQAGVAVTALRQVRVGLRSAIGRGRHQLWVDLLVTFALVATASGVRVLLSPVLYDRASFVLFTLAVMISAWIGGWRMGILATVLAGIAGIWLFIRPFDTPNVRDIEDIVQSALFALTGCGISFLVGELHAARLSSQMQARAATQSRDELAELLESIAEGFKAYDNEFRLMFMNGAAERMLGRSMDDLASVPAWNQFPAMIGPEVQGLLRRVMSERKPASCESFYELRDRWFAIEVYPFRDGISVLFRDISERKKNQQERERLIGELREAISNVRSLRGLLPICASCKKIRDDRGYWNQLEVYIRDHSEAEFSHSLCPDCVEKYFDS